MTVAIMDMEEIIIIVAGVIVVVVVIQPIVLRDMRDLTWQMHKE